MADTVLRRTCGKGWGVFAGRAFRKGEVILRVDLSEQKRYTLEELEEHPELDGDHADYAGRGKYVVNYAPSGYLNHSCEPNCEMRMNSICVKELVAGREIKKGEELTHDYTATAVDQFGEGETWVLDCRCGSAICRGEVTGNFLAMPEAWQRRYVRNLPRWVRRKYGLRAGKRRI